MIEEIITWCNSNNGFATILLSALTLLVSIIAIIVSIRTARLPYKKKLIVSGGSFISAGGIGLYITATNVGNRQLKISNIGFQIQKHVYINTHTIHESQIILGQGEVTSQYYDINDFKKAIFDMQLNGSTKIYAYAKDTEGKEYKKYFSLIEELKEKYKEQISIKTGLEFGVQTHTISEYEKLFASYPFDFIILSIHQVGDEEFWTNEYQSTRTQQEYNEGYYKELLSVVQNYHNYSVLGHMDLIVRYDEQGPYSFEKVKPIITEILKTVIADGKGIEVNTSNHRYGIADMTPSRDILKLYRELGGTIITIGSDSHKKEHLGAYIDWAKEELRKLGYTQFCTFEKMKPVFHDLMD